MNMWHSLNNEATAVVESVAQSVVQLVGKEGSMGAAVIWQSDGLLVTNAHVALDRRGARSLTVVFQDNERVAGQLVAYDEKRDLAAIRVERSGLTPVAYGNSSLLRAGDYLMALGHPWGIIDGLTSGVLIGSGNNLPEMAGQDWLAVAMKMRPGHSGGALFNAAGELVGINTMIRGPEVSFAIPVNAVKVFMRDVQIQPAERAGIV